MHDRQKSGKHVLGGGVHTHWCAGPNRPHWYGARRRGRQLHSTESTEDCTPSHHASVRTDHFQPLTTGENWWTPSQLEPKGLRRVSSYMPHGKHNERGLQHAKDYSTAKSLSGQLSSPQTPIPITPHSHVNMDPEHLCSRHIPCPIMC